MQGKRYLFLLPLGGILTALCLVFPKIGFLQWLTMMPALLWLFSRVTPEGRPKLRTLYGAGLLLLWLRNRRLHTEIQYLKD